LVVAGLSVTALAACLPTAPEYVDPGAIEEAEGPDSQAGGSAFFTADQVRAAFETLPAAAPLEWTGGVATSTASNPGQVFTRNVSDPEVCMWFYAVEELAFPGDSVTVSSDLLMDTRLENINGPGLDDNDEYADVTVRLLQGPSQRASEFLDQLAAYAPECSSYTITYPSAEWTMTRVDSLEFTDYVTVRPSVERAQMGVVDQEALELSAVSWALVLNGNALIYVSYYGGEGAPYSDPAEGALALAGDVVDALEAQRGE
jgi:hypothetical protein